MPNSKVTRKFERLVFKGIPEQPEQTWERNDNTNVLMRQTGKPQSASINTEVSSESKVIGHFIYDFEQNTQEYISASSNPNSESADKEVELA